MSNDHEIGFGKPPAKYRFQPGQSGNPSGRKRGSKNMSTILNEFLDGKVAVVKDGRRFKMSRREAMVIKQGEKALGGDTRSFELIQRLENAKGAAQEEVEEKRCAVRERDEEIAREFLKSLQMRRDDDES